MVDQKLSKGKLRSNRHGLWNKMDSNKVKVYEKMLRSMEQNG